MDLLVMRERPRRGIRNSGYDVSHMSSPTDPCLAARCSQTILTNCERNTVLVLFILDVDDLECTHILILVISYPENNT